MKTFRVLLACSDRRLNTALEVALRDVCYEQALVECTCTARLDELLHRGSTDEFNLLVVGPDHLVTGPPGRSTPGTLDEATEAIRFLSNRRAVPVLAIGVRAPDEAALLDAGADHVFGILFDRDVLRAELRRILNLAPLAETPPPEPSRWTFAAGLLRSFQKLRQA